MIRFFESDEGFGVFGGGVYFAGIIEFDDGVVGGMHNEEVATEFCDAFFLIMAIEVGQETLSDLEFATGKSDFGLAFGANLGEVAFEEVGDVAGVIRSSESDDVGEFVDFAGGGKDGGTPEGMTENEGGGGEVFAEMVGGGDEVLHIRDEGGVGEVAFGISQSGEVEAQGGDASFGKGAGDGGGCAGRFSASEAVGKNGVGARWAGRKFKEGIEIVSVGSLESHFLGAGLAGDEEVFEGVESFVSGEVFPEVGGSGAASSGEEDGQGDAAGRVVAASEGVLGEGGEKGFLSASGALFVPTEGEVKRDGKGFGSVTGQTQIAGYFEIVVVRERILGLREPLFGREVLVFGCCGLFEGFGHGESFLQGKGRAGEEFGGVDGVAVAMTEGGLLAGSGDQLLKRGAGEKVGRHEAGGSREIVGLGSGGLDTVAEVFEGVFAGMVEKTVIGAHPGAPNRAKDRE